MPSKKDVLLLSVDDAAVTIGAQFREVALGLLITALNPAASSYAWYFLAGSIPGLFLAHIYAWTSTRYGPRQVMIASYGLRLLLVLGLWRVANFWMALVMLAGMATGRGFYSASQAQYVAVQGDFAGTRKVVMRLRQSESAMRLAGPLVAGLVLTEIGYRSGFLLSAAVYVVAMVAIANLSPIASTAAKTLYERLPWRPDGAALAMMGLSFLTWQANTLAMAYTFHVLHRHAFGYGLTLCVWGGSGLAASLLLSYVHTRPMRWIAPMFVILGVSWLILSYGVSFPVFVVLGGVEGLAGWMVQDLAVSFILAQAPKGHSGQARARLNFYDELGSIAGTTSLLLVPANWLVLPMYAILGILGIVMAIAWAIVDKLHQSRHPFQGS